MLFMKTGIKQVIFFGFITMCSSTIAFAMVKEEKTTVAAEKKSPQDKEFERYLLRQPAETRLHYAAKHGRYAYVQELCEQYKKDGTLSKILTPLIINADSSSRDLAEHAPVKLAIRGLNDHLHSHHSYLLSSNWDAQGKVISATKIKEDEIVDNYLRIIALLIDGGPVVKDLTGLDITKTISTEIAAGINENGQFDRTKIFPAVERIFGLGRGFGLSKPNGATGLWF